MYPKTIAFTLTAYILGLLWDANIDEFYCFRVLLPVLAMGLCILSKLKAKK